MDENKTVYSGVLQKMRVELADMAQYYLRLNDDEVAMNPLIGQQLSLVWQGEIDCVGCGRKTKKSFNQGYCYPCFKNKAQCDMCIMKPELCHYDAGTCREPEWGEANCFQPHYVYLANSSGIKVGITRHNQIPTRWIDQGATQALPVMRVNSRLQSGLVEVAMKEFVADKTSWQKMLKGSAEVVDMKAKKAELLLLTEKKLAAIIQQFGADSINLLPNEDEAVFIKYPVKHYPDKVKSFNFDKQAEVSGVLHGIKGQYLLFDSGVINIRKFGGYRVTLTHSPLN